MIINNYQCPKCKKTIESDTTPTCPDCDIEMDKVWGGRANKGGHDFRHQDK